MGPREGEPASAARSLPQSHGLLSDEAPYNGEELLR
jgi:hypothetical protein